jgi:6,7-dimethyl-8-ribityllumazine synthase
MTSVTPNLTSARSFPGARVLIVEARYYTEIADALLEGAKAAAAAAEVKVDVVTVDGALEVPCAILLMMADAQRRGRAYDAVVALGCVIRGETGHYDIVAGESARALMDISVRHGLPLGNGILTVENEMQAMARARISEMDKGGGAMRAALSLLHLRHLSENGVH